jgi:hypothetical protein
MRTATLLLLTYLVAPGGTLLAQRLPPNPFPRTDLALAVPSRRPMVGVPRTKDDIPKLVFAGVLGAAAGFVTGALVFRQTSCDELDCLAPAFYGGLAGLSIGTPFGVHLANGNRGHYGPALAASLAIGAAGLGAAILVEEPRLLFAIPVLQIASSIGIERATSRERP